MTSAAGRIITTWPGHWLPPVSQLWGRWWWLAGCAPPPVQGVKPLTLKWEKEVGGPPSSHPGLGEGLFLAQNQATHSLLVPQMRVGKV